MGANNREPCQQGMGNGDRWVLLPDMGEGGARAAEHHTPPALVGIRPTRPDTRPGPARHWWTKTSAGRGGHEALELLVAGDAIFCFFPFFQWLVVVVLLVARRGASSLLLLYRALY